MLLDLLSSNKRSVNNLKAVSPGFAKDDLIAGSIINIKPNK